MSQANYDLYEAGVKTLAKTLVVKSVATANAINKYVESLTGTPVDSTNPATWKYYMNLGGIYHDIDTPMVIKSLDTQQSIVFSTDELKAHIATRKAYAYGSQYYNDLVAAYPDQEMLILGILNPIDVSTAVNAADNVILWYDPELVESNESNLIPNLQKWINGYMYRWSVPNYSLVDPLYVPAQLATMFAFMPSAILNIRLANCRTLYAHSFHVKEYLASNGGLDEYVTWLDLGQALWLYRNIRYVLRNPGTTATFKLLVDNVLTPKGIPLASFNMRFNTQNMPASVVPVIEYVRKAINLGFNLSGTNIRSTTEMLTEEAPLARSNQNYLGYFESVTDGAFQSSLMDNLPVKLLESNLTDTTDSSPFPLTAMLINEWLHLASMGLLESFITVSNPAKATSYTLSMPDAFILYYYTFFAQYGIFLDTIPTFTATCVLKPDTPTVADMQAMVSSKYVPTAYLQQAHDLLPPKFFNQYLSVEGFYSAVSSLHDALLSQRLIYTQLQSFQGRAQAEAAILSLYEDVAVVMPTNTYDYPLWLKDRTIDLTSMSSAEYGTLAQALVAAATGIAVGTTDTLSATQQAMLAIMTKLSSYSVQYARVITPQGILVADWSAVRLGDVMRHEKRTTYVDSAPTMLTDKDVHIGIRLQADLQLDSPSVEVTIHNKISVDLNTDLDIFSVKGVSRQYTVPLTKVGFTVVPTTQVDLSQFNGATPVNPITGYTPTALTPVADQLLYNLDTTYTNVASTTQNPFQSTSDEL